MTNQHNDLREEVKSAEEIADILGISFGHSNLRSECLKAMEEYAKQFKSQLSEAHKEIEELKRKVGEYFGYKSELDYRIKIARSLAEDLEKANARIKELERDAVRFAEWINKMTRKNKLKFDSANDELGHIVVKHWIFWDGSGGFGKRINEQELYQEFKSKNP